MSKLLKILAGIFVLLAVAIITPFTPFGNSLLKPFIQQKIDELSPLPLELSHFNLGFSRFEFELKGKDSLFIKFDGDYSLLLRSVDSLISFDVKDLSYITNPISPELQGAFSLNAKLFGDVDKLSIVGESDIAQSDTKFIIELRNLTLYSIVSNIKQARLETLLQTLNKPAYANALVDFNAKIDSTDGGFKGSLELLASGGEVIGEVIKNEFGVTIPNTLFNLRLTSAFDGDNVAHDMKLSSNLGNITSSGATNIKTFTTDSLYALDFSNLSPLTPVVGIPLRGELKATGRLKGDKHSLVLDGTSDLGGSNSDYLIRFSDLSPSTADIKVENLRIERLFYMLHKPAYTSGNLSLNATLKDLLDGVSGELKLQIPSALTNSDALKNDFNITLPQTKLSLDVKAMLHKGKGEVLSVLDSQILNLSAPKSEIAFKPQFSLNAPYELSIPDLSLLAPLTGRKLNGAIEANGKVVQNSDGLYADFASEILGGKVKGSLKNSELSVVASQIDLLELLKLADYPGIFTSKADVNLAYNTLLRTGNLHMLAKGGRFMENQLSQILKPLFGVDLTREIYEKTELASTINAGEIRSNLAMSSKNSALNAQNALTDIDKNLIDATLNLKIKNRPATITLSGALDKPKVALDTQGLLKEKAGKAIDKHLDKHLPENAKEPIKSILKGLF